MESTPTCGHDAPETVRERHRRNRKLEKLRRKLPKYILPNRVHLDGRTAAAKEFDRLYAAVSSDLGNDLTAVEKALVEGFVGATVVLQSLNTQLALGQEIDLADHSAVCSSMVRIAAKIGLSRRSRIVSGLIEAEAAPPSWSPLRDEITRELAKRVGLDDE
jgi:hypothetical protein